MHHVIREHFVPVVSACEQLSVKKFAYLLKVRHETGEVRDGADTVVALVGGVA
jgi:hypothetical protein